MDFDVLTLSEAPSGRRDEILVSFDRFFVLMSKQVSAGEGLPVIEFD